MARQRAEEIASQVVRLLKQKREELGMSMYEVAKKSGLSPSMVSRVEKEIRRPTLDTLLRISTAMGIELAPIIKKSESGSPLLKSPKT